ncbi:MAG: hypothetical protein K0V04_04895 [Deltaproteobacteria bacterium]|nr:hypothetical protein [Deltaproteobacteria bacterium]
MDGSFTTITHMSLEIVPRDEDGVTVTIDSNVADSQELDNGAHAYDIKLTQGAHECVVAFEGEDYQLQLTVTPVDPQEGPGVEIDALIDPPEPEPVPAPMPGHPGIIGSWSMQAYASIVDGAPAFKLKLVHHATLVGPSQTPPSWGFETTYAHPEDHASNRLHILVRPRGVGPLG